MDSLSNFAGAAVSIPSNFAEGQGRRGPAEARHFRRPVAR